MVGGQLQCFQGDFGEEAVRTSSNGLISFLTANSSASSSSCFEPVLHAVVSCQS